MPNFALCFDNDYTTFYQCYNCVITFVDHLVASLSGSRDYTQFAVSYISLPLTFDSFDCHNELAQLSHFTPTQTVLPFNSLSNQLGPYLAGLIEGDGSLITPQALSGNTPTIHLSCHAKDLPFATFLMETIGGGTIH